MSETNPQQRDDVSAQIVALRPRLVRFAWSLTRDPSAAEDLAQETIARALTSQRRFQPGTNLKAWLFRILRNVHLNIVRGARAHSALVSIEQLAGEANPTIDADPVAALVIERAEMQQIVAAYRSLPPAYALPLYLTAVEELTYAEAAAIIDIPVGTVMSRVYRARRLLISRLEEGQ